nr:MAG TPA: hypothetical protein [Caudoviricetes sp.]
MINIIVNCIMLYSIIVMFLFSTICNQNHYIPL